MLEYEHNRRLLRLALAVNVLAAGCAADVAQTDLAEPAAQAALVEPAVEPQIRQVTVNGPSCPPGSYHTQIAPEGDRAAVEFDSFAATLRSSDEENSAKYDARAECEVVIRYAGRAGLSYATPNYKFTSRRSYDGSLSAGASYHHSWDGIPPYQWPILPRSAAIPPSFGAPGVTWSGCGGDAELRLQAFAIMTKRLGTPWGRPEESLTIDGLAIEPPLVRRCDERSAPYLPPERTPAVAPVARIVAARTTGIGCPSGSARVAADGTSLTVDLRAMSMTMEHASFQYVNERACRLQVDVDVPPGQSFTLQRHSFTGTASIPRGFVGSIHRDAEGQAHSKPSIFVGPYAMGFMLPQYFDRESRFVGEDPPKVPCGQKTMEIALVSSLWSVPYELMPPTSASTTAVLRSEARIDLATAEMAFALQPCAETKPNTEPVEGR